jgi:hypothetical protein
MKNRITIEDNPSEQKPTYRIKEISFWNNEGEYYGCLMSLRFYEDQETGKMKPLINLYRIDEGIKVKVSEERDKR